MDGIVLAYSLEKGAGVIKGQNGQPYYFAKEDCICSVPRMGQPIRFEANGGKAEKITESPQDSSVQ